METVEEANGLLTCSGVSQEFLDFLPKVKMVAGDIPETAAFRDQFHEVKGHFKSLYDEEVKKEVKDVQVNAPAMDHSVSLVAALAAIAVLLF